MKTINKRTLETLIELLRELNETPYEEGNSSRIIQEAITVAKAIELSEGLNWNVIYDFVWSVIRGLDEDATNEDIYMSLAFFGWKVKDYEAA